MFDKFLSNLKQKPDKLFISKDSFVKWDNFVILDEILPSKWQWYNSNLVRFVNWNIQSEISLSNHFIQKIMIHESINEIQKLSKKRYWHFKSTNWVNIEIPSNEVNNNQMRWNS